MVAASSPCKIFRAIAARPQEMDYRNFRYALSENPIVQNSPFILTCLCCGCLLKRGNQPIKILVNGGRAGQLQQSGSALLYFSIRFKRSNSKTGRRGRGDASEPEPPNYCANGSWQNFYHARRRSFGATRAGHTGNSGVEWNQCRQGSVGGSTDDCALFAPAYFGVICRPLFQC